MLFLFPNFAFAQEDIPILKHALLSQFETQQFLNGIQKELLSREDIMDFVNLNGKDQAALAALRENIRENFLSFLPGFIATETVKIVVNVASEIKKIPTSTTEDLIGKIETLTAKEAARIGFEWLSQNDIKVSSGNLDDSQTNIHFQYVMTYQSIDRDHAKILADFYSADPFTPLRPTSSFQWGNPYFSEDLTKDGKVPPFIIHVQAQVERIGAGWAIQSGTKTEISVKFPEKVPKLALSKELPYPIEEQKISLLNQWIAIKNAVATLGLAGNATWQNIQRAGDKIYSVAKEITLFFSFIQNLSSKNTGAGIALAPLEVSTSKKNLAVPAKSAIAKEESSLSAPSGASSKAPSKNPLENPLKDAVKDSPKKVVKETAKETASVAKAKSAEVSCATSFDMAPQQNAVILNEIAWAGTPASSSDEYIELKNVSQTEIMLAGWQVVDRNEKIKIVFEDANKIPAQGFFLLERTDDSSVPNVPADLIYANAIGNTKEELYVFDDKCVMRDKVAANPAWPAGDSALRKSMERGKDFAWHTYAGPLQNYIFGTPKAENSIGQAAVINFGGGIGSSAKEAAGSAQKNYQKILISEIQVEGNGAKDEFIELLNPNGAEVDLAGWALKKKTASGAESNLVSSSGFSGTIPAKGYFLIAPQKENDGTQNYKGQALPDLYYSGKTYSIAPDNTVLLYNPNAELADKVGFGSVLDFEIAPAQNPASGSSLGRKTTGGVLQDTDDNSRDFEIQTSTPKLANHAYAAESAPPAAGPILVSPPDTTSPQVAFNPVGSAQTNTLFSLSWSGSDPLGDVSPSGIDGFYLQYSVTPTQDGIFLQYENNGAMQNWQQGITGEIALASSINSVSLTAQDGLGYAFSLKAKDAAGNESAAAAASTEINLAKTIVINEIAWAGTKASVNDEWVELFNSADSPISVAGWKLQAGDGIPNITLSGTIGARNYFLLERTNDTTINDIAADQIYTGALGNDGENLKLYDAQNNLIDAVDASSGWFAGDNTTKQSMERIDSAKGGSDHGNWASNNLIKHNGKDAVNGFINGTPKQENSVSVQSTQIVDLRFSEFGNSLTLRLLGSPYITDSGGITVPENATLLVEPGVTIKFKNNYAQFIVDGTLKAVGSNEKRITFTTDSTNGGPWCSLSFNSTSINSDLEYVIVDAANRTTCGGANHYALLVEGSAITFKNSSIAGGNSIRKLYLKGSNSLIDGITISGAAFDQNSSAVFIDGGSPTIQNSTFSSNSIGIFSTAAAALPGTPIIRNNTFSQNTFPIRFNNPSISLSGNTAVQNTYNGAYADGAVYYADAVWRADLPYIIESFTVNAGKKLTLQEGAQIQFANLAGGNRELIVNGTLFAQGTAEKQITFTALNGGANPVSNWRRIYFAPGSAGSIVQNAVLEYGGNRLNEGALYVESGGVQIQNASILLKDNAFAFFVSGTCPAISGAIISGGEAFGPASVVCSL